MSGDITLTTEWQFWDICRGYCRELAHKFSGDDFCLDRANRNKPCTYSECPFTKDLIKIIEEEEK